MNKKSNIVKLTYYFQLKLQFLRKKRQISGTHFSMSEEEIKKMLRWLLFFLVGHNSSS